jgi:hypothetical protein
MYVNTLRSPDLRLTSVGPLLGNLIAILMPRRYWSEKTYSSVADPDPHIFGPPGSGSISQSYGSGRILLSSCKNGKKNLDSYYFVTLF